MNSAVAFLLSSALMSFEYPVVYAWIPPTHVIPVSSRRQSWPATTTRTFAQPPAGSFFYPVPKDDDDNKPKPIDRTKVNDDNLPFDSPSPDSFEADLMKMLRQRKAPSLASQPSTIDGNPTAGMGFGTAKNTTDRKKAEKPYIGIGPPRLNDPTKPEYDDQGYTLYSDEQTGKKSRVFEALVEYPCDFTLKIVGANEGSFVAEIIAVVAESCFVAVDEVPHSTRVLGKWMSVTVQAPVQSAEMLYQLYENVDRDPRVRFKF